jgi:hypothetical protein
MSVSNGAFLWLKNVLCLWSFARPELVEVVSRPGKVESSWKDSPQRDEWGQA